MKMLIRRPGVYAIYRKRITGYIKKRRYDIKRNRKADAGNLCTDQKRYKNIKKAGQKAYQYGAAAALAVSDLCTPQELRISVHIPICLAMCSDSRAVRQKKLMIRS